MPNSLTQKPSRALNGLGLLLCLLLSLASQQAFAVIENNMNCTATGTTDIDLGNLEPREKFQFHMTASCRVTRTFPVGASLGHTQAYHGSLQASKMTVFHTNSGQLIPDQEMGTSGAVCLPSSCVKLNQGTTFTYSVLVSGTAGSAFGNYYASVVLNDTSIGGWEGYGDILQNIAIRYIVTRPTCSLGSSETMSLPFGTLSSNDFATSQQVANITMNCVEGTQATATLVPTQSAVSGSAGVSATTLAGLSMAATWADTGTAVTFNSPRTLALRTGANNISLGFRPVLNSSVSPSGNFSSQYTLNINYL